MEAAVVGRKDDEPSNTDGPCGGRHAMFWFGCENDEGFGNNGCNSDTRVIAGEIYSCRVGEDWKV